MWVKAFREPGKVSPPEARAISSSCVRLAPGERVGEHVTAAKEELLFVLEGEATVLVRGTATAVPAGNAAYVPPDTPHDVANVASAPLVYVYVTARLAA